MTIKKIIFLRIAVNHGPINTNLLSHEISIINKNIYIYIMREVYLMGLLPTRMDRMALPTSQAILSLQSLPSMDSATSLVSEASSSGARFNAALEVSACIGNIGMNMSALRNTTATPTNPAMATNRGSTRGLAAAWFSDFAGSESDAAVVDAT